jgi:hypothetical protein
VPAASIDRRGGGAKMKTHWPLQARLIEQNIKQLTRNSHENISFTSPALKALEEILARTSVQICRNCNGQKGFISVHPSGRAEDIFQDCFKCHGTGMVIV